LSPPMGSLPSRPPTPCLMPPPLLLAGVPGFLSPPLDGLEPKPPNLLPPDDEAGLSLPRSGGRSPPDGADDRNVPMPPGRDAKPPLLEAAGRLSRRSSGSSSSSSVSRRPPITPPGGLKAGRDDPGTLGLPGRDTPEEDEDDDEKGDVLPLP